MRREDALDEYYNHPPFLENELLDYFKKRLGLTEAEFQHIMDQPPKYWTDFPTYKKRFEKLRPLFFTLMKADLVPRSFYMKYCFPIK